MVLDYGEALAADLVVVGLGIKPATDILQGVKLNADGSVSMDRRMRVTEGRMPPGTWRGFRLARRLRHPHRALGA